MGFGTKPLPYLTLRCLEVISRAAIDQAFEFCLRRPVESEAAYDHFAALDSIDAMYAALFASPEFRGRLLPEPQDTAAAPLEIEVDASSDALARMVARVEATWTRLGETEPHWSVVTDPRFKPAQFATHAALYRASGQHDEARLAAAAARAGIDLTRRRACFELGCGTGRITEWLAVRFPQVMAVDISPTHLDVARAALAGLGHVSLLHLARLEDLAALPAYDMLYCRLVLQHNPPPVIAAVLAQVLAGLAPGGAGFVQVPVWIPGYRFRVAEYLAEFRTAQMEMHALPQRTLLAIVQDAGCRVRELREDPLGPQFGGISNTLLVEKAGLVEKDG